MDITPGLPAIDNVQHWLPDVADIVDTTHLTPPQVAAQIATAVRN